MTANEYQRLALRTEKTPAFCQGDGERTDHQQSRLLHGAIGICTEAGELQDMIKKSLIYGKPMDVINIVEEIGDLYWYCALVLDSVGYTPEQAMEKNINKLRARFGDRFTEYRALNRDLDLERKELEK